MPLPLLPTAQTSAGRRTPFRRPWLSRRRLASSRSAGRVEAEEQRRRGERDLGQAHLLVQMRDGVVALRQHGAHARHAARSVDRVQRLELAVHDRQRNVDVDVRFDYLLDRRAFGEGHVGGEHEDRFAEGGESSDDAGHRLPRRLVVDHLEAGRNEGLRSAGPQRDRKPGNTSRRTAALRSSSVTPPSRCVRLSNPMRRASPPASRTPTATGWSGACPRDGISASWYPRHRSCRDNRAVDAPLRCC